MKKIVKEDGKIYEILVGAGSITVPYSENKQAELFMGPFLMKEKVKLLKSGKEN